MFNFFKKKYFDFSNLDKLPKNNYHFEKKTFLFGLNKSLKEFKKKKIFYKRNLSYPNIATFLNYIKKDIDFFDFGANDLDNFFYLSKNLKKNFKYFYYDQVNKSKIVNKFIKLNNLNNIIVLKENLKDLKKLSNKNSSIFFLGSMIQYLKNHENFLKKIFKLRPDTIMICGNIFYINKHELKKKIVIKQLNMKPQIFYQYFYNLNMFIEFFRKNNYFLSKKEKNTSDQNLNLSNLNPFFDKIDRYNLIFKKKND